MVDPTGKSFLSYRRSRADEAALLIAAQHLYGIPTWQDIADLDTGLTARQITDALDSPGTANAVLWITPDVRDSSFMQKIEVPRILDRADSGDGFFEVTVAAGGLDYERAAATLDPRLSLHDLRLRNLMQAKTDPITEAFASEVARRVLKQRLKAAHRFHPSGAPLQLRLSTWSTDGPMPGNELMLDWRSHFNGRLAPASVWRSKLLPALTDLVETVGTQAPERRIEASGKFSFAAALALGSAFRQTGRVRLDVSQDSRDGSAQLWSVYSRREAVPLAIQSRDDTLDSEDLAVLVSIIVGPKETENDLALSRAALPKFRGIVQIANTSGVPLVVNRPEEAADIAWQVRDAIHEAITRFHPIGTIHLFVAAPVALAVLMGQLFNTLPAVQVYEHVRGASPGPYQPALWLDPSNS
ncbi:MAG: SAVED domain-containing protein [Verrucomicrobiales bacterium]|nr:SAVED domain-containing protein [Verrucomicrobiales bacterium]